MNMRRNLFMHLVVPIVAGRWQGIANEMENKKMGGGGFLVCMANSCVQLNRDEDEITNQRSN
jgi:hypothetical protein